MVPDRIIKTDVFIIGSEGAGARAAIEAAKNGASVIVASKSKVTKSGATLCAPGDFSVNSKDLCSLGLKGDIRDSWQEHANDTIESGRHINSENLVKIMCENAFSRLIDTCNYGVKWSQLFHYPGHKYPRGAAVGKVGQTGIQLTKALFNAAKSCSVQF